MTPSSTLASVRFERPVDRDAELRASPDVRFLDLPTRTCVMIDGDGPPAEATLGARMPGLYGTAWPLRFALKRRGPVTRVGPLEGLWWSTGAATLASIFDAGGAGDGDDWRWTLLMVLPDEATDAELATALEAGRGRLPPELAATIRIERFDEGRVAQLLHVGPYAAERPTIERLHAAIGAAGLTPTGRHHELYLGDPRRSAPERLRTLLRQPVR